MESFSANVITGSGRGKDMGFPTFNLDTESIPDDLKEGIYAARVRFEDQTFPAAIHYGARPVHDDSPSFEVHVIDETFDSAPISMEVELIQHIRDVMNFDSESDLIHQLQMDITTARGILLSP